MEAPQMEAVDALQGAEETTKEAFSLVAEALEERDPKKHQQQQKLLSGEIQAASSDMGAAKLKPLPCWRQGEQSMGEVP